MADRINCGAGVWREDRPGASDCLMVLYYIPEDYDAGVPLGIPDRCVKIGASRNGVFINNILVHAEGRERFETLLGWAFKLHDHFRARGHDDKSSIPQDQLGTIPD